MGAVDFITYSEGQTISEAFRVAFDQAGYEDGHLYSGTIASMSYHQEFPSPPVPLGLARQIAEREFDAWRSHCEDGEPRKRPTISLEKGSNAVGVPVASDASFSTRSKTVTLTVEGPQRYLSTPELTKLAEVELKAGEIVTEAKILDRASRFSVKAAASEGKAVTRFFLTTPSGSELPRQGGGFPTQAAARAAALKLVKSEGSLGGLYREGIGVVGKRVREDGTPLVLITRQNAKERIKIRFKIAKPKTARPKIKGWLFYGIAPH